MFLPLISDAIDSDRAFGITNMGAAFKIAREEILTGNPNDR